MVNLQAKEARYNYMMENSQLFSNISINMTNFSVLVSFNLILILSLVWSNISQSKHVRVMVESLQKSIEDLLIFMIIVCITMIALITFNRNSFSHASSHLEDLAQTGTTLLKLFIG
jgi:L-lactate permease